MMTKTELDRLVANPRLRGLTPRRIQRRRTKGWRMPPNAVYVGRPTKWGNPFVSGEDGNPIQCVELYRQAMHESPNLCEAAYLELAGKDLVCWCPLDQPCHADILLRIANDHPNCFETTGKHEDQSDRTVGGIKA